jgi:hypothetical protein
MTCCFDFGGNIEIASVMKGPTGTALGKPYFIDIQHVYPYSSFVMEGAI